jgi:hypothetical protein
VALDICCSKMESGRRFTSFEISPIKEYLLHVLVQRWTILLRKTILASGLAYLIQYSENDVLFHCLVQSDTRKITI